MTERPILFSSAMVRAILEGRKTQTRRPVKPQPVVQPYWIEDRKEWVALDESIKCPYGSVGYRLYVREKFRPVRFPGKPVVGFHYADGHAWLAQIGNESYRFPKGGGSPDEQWPEGFAYGWRPSIHMPRWASRITLGVAGVRVERLNEISEEDAKAEGAIVDQDCIQSGGSYRTRFHGSWNGIYAARGFGWDKNPWVWVVEFARVA